MVIKASNYLIQSIGSFGRHVLIVSPNFLNISTSPAPNGRKNTNNIIVSDFITEN